MSVKKYFTEGLFKLNIITIEMNKKYVFLTFLSQLWHEHLRLVNYKMLWKLINLDVLPNFDCNKSQCQKCVEFKFAKYRYKSIERNFKPLQLIHTDTYDIDSTPSRGKKKYFITFINNYARYYYVYLINSKDEVIKIFRQYKTIVKN